MANMVYNRGKVLVIGDLHFSDAYVGSHKDYWQNCLEVAGTITNIIRNNNITHLFLTGDLFGLKEKNFKNRDSLLTMMVLFQEWNRLTNNNVYSLVGNHDIGGKTTDFNVFEAIGLIKTTSLLQEDSETVAYVDIGCVRYHLIDYGAEHKKLSIKTGEHAENVGITHADIQVTGKTTWWYPSKTTYELATMDNWVGLGLVVAGHIHNPSPQMVETSICGSSNNTMLFYVGNPTRPSRNNDWSNVWGIVIDATETTADLDIIPINLKPFNEIMATTVSDEDSAKVTDDVDLVRVSDLTKVLETLHEYKLDTPDDIPEQIKVYGGNDSGAIEMALKYYNDALNGDGVS